jgi:hypothetical protein
MSGQAEDATCLAFAIARSGAAGVSWDGLRRVVRLSPEAVGDLPELWWWRGERGAWR